MCEVLGFWTFIHTQQGKTAWNTWTIPLSLALEQQEMGQETQASLISPTISSLRLAISAPPSASPWLQGKNGTLQREMRQVTRCTWSWWNMRIFIILYHFIPFYTYTPCKWSCKWITGAVMSLDLLLTTLKTLHIAVGISGNLNIYIYICIHILLVLFIYI